jgi:hypothetical protein
MRRRVRPTMVALWMICGLFLTLQAQDSQKRRGFAVELTEPVNQDIVFGKTRIAASVKIANLDLVDRVEFTVGEEVIFVDREPPFECVHDFGEESRSWIVRAVAYHEEGVQVSDAIITRKLKFSTFERRPIRNRASSKFGCACMRRASTSQTSWPAWDSIQMPPNCLASWVMRSQASWTRWVPMSKTSPKALVSWR